MLKLSESAPRPLRLLSAGQRVSKKYKKQSIRRKMWKSECKNLKAIVPKVAHKKVSEVTVIEEAIEYIEHLHTAIAQRLGMAPGCPAPSPSMQLPFGLNLPANPNAKLAPHCPDPAGKSAPIRLPFVDEAFVRLLQTQGSQHLWGSNPTTSTSLYQKQLS